VSLLDPGTLALLGQLGISAESIESLISATLMLTVLAVVAAVPTAMIAQRKNRSRTFWVLAALSIPVIPLLLVWMLPALTSRISTTPRRD